MSDRTNTIAQSKEVLIKNDLKDILKILKEYISNYEIDEIVVGMPTSLNGTKGPRAKKTDEFINFLNNHLEIKVTEWDERYTTMIAEQSMIDADLSRRKRKQLVDKIAAALILQNYLDYLNKKDGEKDE